MRPLQDRVFTFTLHPKVHGSRPINVDLYRLDDPREIADPGLEEIADEGILAIEWPAGAISVRVPHAEANARTT